MKTSDRSCKSPGGASAKSKENGVALPTSSIQQFSTIYRYIGSITSFKKKNIVFYLQLPSETHVFLIWNVPKNVITNPASESWSLSQHLDSSHSSIHPPNNSVLAGDAPSTGTELTNVKACGKVPMRIPIESALASDSQDAMFRAQKEVYPPGN